MDNIGNVQTTGYLGRTVTFRSTTLVSQGGSDVFVAKLNTNGDRLWSKIGGGTFEDSGWGIAVDTKGNVYITGTFYESATFGTTSTVGLMNDVFVAKLSIDGIITNGDMVNSDKVSNDKDSGNGTPGFEILFLLISLATILFLKKRRKNNK